MATKVQRKLYPVLPDEIGLVTNADSDYAYDDYRRYDGIQESVDALASIGSNGGGLIRIPGTTDTLIEIADQILLPPRTAGSNHKLWYALRGAGRGGPRITAIAGMAGKAMINSDATAEATSTFYREVSDMYLAGSGIARIGVSAKWNQHFKLENLFINGLKNNGADKGAGVLLNDVLCSQFRDLKIHNGEGFGIHSEGGSGSFFNANLIAGCSFLDLTESGIYISGGITGSVIIGCTMEFCDQYGWRSAGYSGGGVWLGGNYFEVNLEGDIYIGENTSQQQFVVEANYLNGFSVGLSAATYTPIKMKFANGVTIRRNYVNIATKSASGYYILDANISGGAVSNCTVEDNSVSGLASSTRVADIYNLPSSWVKDGNRLIDPTFAPLHQANLIPERWSDESGQPWTYSLSGTSVATPDDTKPLLGATSLRLARLGGGVAQISRTFTFGSDQSMLNRFVTMAIPIKGIATAKQITINLTPNGTNPQTAAVSTFTGGGAQILLYAMCYVPSDATQIAISVVIGTADGDFYLGQPCLYVGAQPWYSSAGDDSMVGTAAPTLGTYKRGRRCWNVTPAAAGVPGWVCVTAGTPGTWKAMAALAA